MCFSGEEEHKTASNDEYTTIMKNSTVPYDPLSPREVITGTLPNVEWKMGDKQT